MLTELGDWLVEGFEADELRIVATLPQVQPEDAALIVWRLAQAKYPPSNPDRWTFRCRSRGLGGPTLLRFFCVTDGALEAVVEHPSWRPSFVEAALPGGLSWSSPVLSS
jgi:hypothetical protein